MCIFYFCTNVSHPRRLMTRTITFNDVSYASRLYIYSARISNSCTSCEVLSTVKNVRDCVYRKKVLNRTRYVIFDARIQFNGIIARCT